MQSTNQCEYCQRKFTSPRGLSIHKGRMHKDEARQMLRLAENHNLPSSEFDSSEESLVGRRPGQREELEHPHECSHCDRVFTSHRGLNIHLARKHQVTLLIRKCLT